MALPFGKKKKEVELPAVLTQQEDPVNYNSVLDYLVGLSEDEFKKMTESAKIYRKADREVAVLIGVENEPTTTIAGDKPTDEEVDEAMEHVLSGDFIDDGPKLPKPVKIQSASKKVEAKVGKD